LAFPVPYLLLLVVEIREMDHASSATAVAVHQLRQEVLGIRPEPAAAD
jgi:hypothetical protein